MTLYSIKPRFQALLRPLVKRLFDAGVSANQVTIVAAAGSILLGLVLALNIENVALFLLLPFWMLVRMALNAIDGMMAREFNQQSSLGAVLNEMGDVLSDTALILPFALLAPFNPFAVVLVAVLAMLTEFVGVVGQSLGASRRYDGPMGKSDRALVFAILGLWVGLCVGLGLSLPEWLAVLMPVLSVLLMLTIIKRVQAALAETE